MRSKKEHGLFCLIKHLTVSEGHACKYKLHIMTCTSMSPVILRMICHGSLLWDYSFKYKLYFLSTKSNPWSFSYYVNTENVILHSRFKIPKNDRNKMLWRKTEHNYMYNHNTIQYYQTLFDNAVEILKTQFMLILHYTQH